jgi:hypothetical protein
MGNVYMIGGSPSSERPARLKMLNTLAVQEDGTRIECRHLSLQEIHAAQSWRQKRSAEKFAVEWSRVTDSVESIQHSVTATDARYMEVLTQFHEGNIVGHTQLGNFMRDQFSAMNPGERRYFFCHIGRHANAVELASVKDSTGTRYVATMYDPNFTNVRMRMQEDSLDRIEKWEMGSLMAQPLIDDYCSGDSGNDMDEMSCFYQIPSDFHTRSMSESIFDGPSKRRTLREYLSEREASQPARYFYLLSSGQLSADGLRESLGPTAIPGEAYALLSARSAQGVPPLLGATAFGDTGSVQKFGEVLLEMRRIGRITNEEMTNILTNSGEQHPVASALHYGKADGAHAWFDVVEKAQREGWLSNDDVQALLDRAKPAVEDMLSKGNQDALRTFTELSERARGAREPTSA